MGPSSWSTNVPCPAARKAQASWPDETGYAAAEGSVFHETVSDCLILGLNFWDFVGSTLKIDGYEIEIDAQMARSAEEGMAFIRSYEGDPDVQIFIETRVDISPWTLPGQFGTADVVIVNVKERWVIVFDWKYGQEPVYAEENEQGQGYCLGAWNTLFGELFNWDPAGIKVTIFIEQPRVPGAGGTWETTMVRVLEFGQYVKRQAMLSESANPPFNPGVKQCRWCRARFGCAARTKWIAGLLDQELDDLDAGYNFNLEPILPSNLSPERRAYITKSAPLIRAWLNDLSESEHRDAEHGRPTPGKKLVLGKHPARRWKENAAAKAARALVLEVGKAKAYTEPKLLSPAAAQDEVGRARYEEVLERYVDKGEPRRVLVDENDTRKPVASLLDALDDL